MSNKVELVDQGIAISELSRKESKFTEFDEGEVRFYLNENITQAELTAIHNTLLKSGVTLTAPIVQDARIVSIKFRKEIAPLLVIGGAVAAVVSGVVGWQIFKVTKAGVPLWAILVGGGALLYLIFREPVKKAAPYAIKAGKVYITKGVLK